MFLPSITGDRVRGTLLRKHLCFPSSITRRSLRWRLKAGHVRELEQKLVRYIVDNYNQRNFPKGEEIEKGTLSGGTASFALGTAYFVSFVKNFYWTASLGNAIFGNKMISLFFSNRFNYFFWRYSSVNNFHNSWKIIIN